MTPCTPLKEKMVKFIRQREAAITATTPSCHEVQLSPKIFQDKVKKDSAKSDTAQPQSKYKGAAINTSIQPSPQSQLEPEQV